MKSRSIINLVLFAGVILVNTLAVKLPLNNKSTGQLSDQYPNLFVPAGITFSIWGIIYLFLIGALIYQFVQKDAKVITKRHQEFFALSCLCNMAWIFAWHYELVLLSVTIMLLFLIVLTFWFLEVNTIASLWSHHLLVKLPVKIYLGWISVATIANITAALVHYQWKGFGISESNWTVIMIGIGTLLSVFMVWKFKNIPHALVFIWALLGIIIKRYAIAPLNENIIFSCYTAIAIIVLSAILSLLIKRPQLASSH
jgi:tryptophan-rich sensory protein